MFLPSLAFYLAALALGSLPQAELTARCPAPAGEAAVSDTGLSAPTNLTGAATSATTIGVTWNVPAQAQGAEIEGFCTFFSQKSRGLESVVLTSAGSPREADLQDLVPGTHYTIRVLAYNAEGSGPSSEECVIKTEGGEPAEREGDASAHYVFGDTGDEPGPSKKESPDLRGQGTKDPNSLIANSVQATAPSTQGAESPHRREDVFLPEISTAGYLPTSRGPTDVPGNRCSDECVFPGPPQRLSVKSTDSGTLAVTWTPPRDSLVRVRGYTVGWGEGVPDENAQRVDAQQRTCNIGRVKVGTEYVISVRSFNAQGNGPPIYETVRAALKPETLPCPVGLKITAVTNTAVLLTWNDGWADRTVPDASAYRVRYASAPSTLPRRLPVRYRNTIHLNVTLRGLIPDTKYTFAVRTLRGPRLSPWSLPVGHKTKESAPQSSPVNLTVRAATQQSSSVLLSWKPPETCRGVSIDRYVIQYTAEGKTPKEDWGFVDAAAGALTTASIGGLLPDTNYFFKMHARNNAGSGPSGPVVLYTTPSEPQHRLVEKGPTNLLPLARYAGLGTSGLLVVALLLVAGTLLARRCKGVHRSGPSAVPAQNLSQNLPPPDLWASRHKLEREARPATREGQAGRHAERPGPQLRSGNCHSQCAEAGGRSGHVGLATATGSHSSGSFRVATAMLAAGLPDNCTAFNHPEKAGGFWPTARPLPAEGLPAESAAGEQGPEALDDSTSLQDEPIHSGKVPPLAVLKLPDFLSGKYNLGSCPSLAASRSTSSLELLNAEKMEADNIASYLRFLYQPSVNSNTLSES